MPGDERKQLPGSASSDYRSAGMSGSSVLFEKNNVSSINWRNVQSAIDTYAGRSQPINSDLIDSVDASLSMKKMRVKFGNIRGNRFCIRLKDGGSRYFTGILYGGILPEDGDYSNFA